MPIMCKRGGRSITQNVVKCGGKEETEIILEGQVRDSHTNGAVIRGGGEGRCKKCKKCSKTNGNLPHRRLGKLKFQKERRRRDMRPAHLPLLKGREAGKGTPCRHERGREAGAVPPSRQAGRRQS